MKTIYNILTSYFKLCPVYVKLKRTNQSCSPSKISQSVNVEWCTYDRNSKQIFQWKQEKLYSFDTARIVLTEKKKKEIWAISTRFC